MVRNHARLGGPVRRHGGYECVCSDGQLWMCVLWWTVMDVYALMDSYGCVCSDGQSWMSVLWWTVMNVCALMGGYGCVSSDGQLWMCVLWWAVMDVCALMGSYGCVCSDGQLWMCVLWWWVPRIYWSETGTEREIKRGPGWWRYQDPTTITEQVSHQERCSWLSYVTNPSALLPLKWSLLYFCILKNKQTNKQKTDSAYVRKHAIFVFPSLAFCLVWSSLLFIYSPTNYLCLFFFMLA